MTQDDKNQQSVFNQRADQAARALKEQLGQRMGVEIPSTQVEVGPDGRPPAPLPPEGSYARQAIEARRQEEAHARQLQQQANQQAEVEEQAQEAPSPPAQPQQEEQQISENAQSRIRELVAQLREKDTELETLRKSQEESNKTLAQVQASQQAMEAQYQRIVDQNLDALDPETRALVLADARIQEAVQRSNQQLLQMLTPRLERFERSQAQQEMNQLSATYAGFDLTVHPPLIQAFRERNPNCSIEQAFRAVARPEELAPKARPANPVPPSIPPGSGSPTPRYVPTQEQQKDPSAELAEEAAQAAKLRRSNDPAERKQGLKMFDQNLKSRIFGQ